VLRAGALLAACAALVAGCGDDGAKTFRDPDGTLTVTAGEDFRVELEENPSTGYAWRFVQRPDPAVARLAGSSYEPEEGAGNRAGAGGTRTFRFHAEAPGRTTMSLEYVFSHGESSRRPASRKRLVVAVG
jgi:inhibitor of cysteine peptidase